MRNAIDVLLSLIEKPESEKLYLELKSYYSSVGDKAEEEALGYLIQARFHENPDDVPPHTE